MSNISKTLILWGLLFSAITGFLLIETVEKPNVVTHYNNGYKTNDRM